MKRYAAIGVPLDGSSVSVQSLGCATWLGSHLGARLHALNVDGRRPADEAPRALGVPEKYWPLFEFHQLDGEPAEEILAAERRLGLDMIVMTARGASSLQPARDGTALIGHVAREVIERSRAPVVLLPPRYREALPWRSALVPLSGELADESLTVALQVALPLDLSVTIAHVAAPGAQGIPGGVGGFADELHHEYPHRLNELVARACPTCSAEERSRIEDFRLCHGDIAEELLALVERKRVGVIVVGWHGRFAAGHAEVLKTLIRESATALLLVKAAQPQPFRLKVGDAV